MGEDGSGAPWIVDRYEIHQAIGSGGMATVHLGRLRGPVGFTRTVAIKRLREQFASNPQFVTMFVDEARIAARVHHPNVLQTFDVLATGGELLLVMEYVHGESLSRLLRAASEAGAPVPLPIVSAITVQMLEGLHAAHTAADESGRPLGIVHRDVSPENVLIGVDGLTRVLDFGVAKAADRLHKTQHGEVKGKLAYLAPEQAFGHADPRSDVFSAAVVLWELLTGRGLFRSGQRNLSREMFETEPIEAPSVQVPSAAVLDAVVLRGLDRAPERRFQSAREMALAIESAVPPAGPATVGGWVEKTGGPSLSERRRDLGELDHATSATGISPAPARETPPPLDPPPRSRRVLAISLAGALALAIIALAALELRQPKQEPPNPAGRVDPDPDPDPDPAPEPARQPAEPPARSPGPAAESAPRPAKAVSKPAAHARPHAPKPPDGKCAVPWILDAQGIKHYKPECL
jgi:serine/threonine-protein kinase